MAEASRNLFSEDLVTDLFTKVRGKSALAELSQQEGTSFVGTETFTFQMDDEVDVVAENGAYSAGKATFEPVKVVPIEMEYGTRISREFIYASEEKQLKYLEAFNDGFAKKLARGLDIAAMHGFNPRTGTASETIGTNHFDNLVSQTVVYAPATVDQNIDDAIALVPDADVTGIAMSKVMASNMAKIKENGVTAYPEFKFGGVPSNLGGATLRANSTVNKGPSGAPDHAIVGDFENAFKWGFGKDIEFEVIKFGDPDNAKKDLAGNKQVYIRATAYIGWGILAPEYFARVVGAGA